MDMVNLDSLKYLSRELSVLFVEDEENLCQEMSEALNDIFSRVAIAEDGKEGWERYLSFYKEYGTYPDIIITDINMPHLSGVEMSRKILSLNPEQMIVVLSANNKTEYVLELLNMGVDAYVLKPIGHETFLQTLQRVSKKVIDRKMALDKIKELESMAYVDPLTGISNRHHFFNIAKELPLGKTPPLPPFTLCIVDLDKLKDINDRYGHDMGDAVLCRFVEIMQKELYSKECFARFGGDEFMVILQRNNYEIEEVLRRINAAIGYMHELLGKHIYFSISMGWTQITSKDLHIDAVIKRADLQLYEMKQAKRQRQIEYVI